MTSDRGGPSDQSCRIVLTTPLAAAKHVEAALEAFCQVMLCEPTAAAHDSVRITGFSRDHPDDANLGAALAAAAAMVGVPPPVPSIVPEPACDWLALNREAFRPFRIGTFFISEVSEAVPAPAGAVSLKIDPGLAFGSGRHASTAGCLLALADPMLACVLRGYAVNSIDALKSGWASPPLLPRVGQACSGHRPNIPAILDLGCGSGILAIAAAKLWHRSVIAADCDRVAVAVATANAQRNQVGSLVHVVAADGTRHRMIRRARPFRLILANILSRPLRQMAPALARISAPGTVLVLAGFVEDDAAAVAAVYAGHAFRRLRTITIDGWTTLALVRG